MTELRVLQVLGRSAGGIGRHVAQVVSRLDGKDGLVVDVAAPPDLEVTMPKPVIEVDVPDGVSTGHLRTIRNLKQLIRSNGYSVVHAHGLRAGLDASLAARSAGVIPVVTLHNLIRPETSGRARSIVWRRAETAVLGLARHVFAVSEEMASVLRDRSVGRGKVEVLPIGIPAPAVARTRAAVRSELGVTDDAPVVVTVARLARQKSLDVMLDAIERLPGVALWIVGDGPLRQELEQQATDLGLVERVRFLGQQAEVGDYLSAADVFALSSSWEARALAAQEAIQLHVPVVTTDVGGMGELIEDRVSGRTVPPGDPGAFAAALGQALEDPAGARRRADVAFNRLSLGSSTEAMLDRLVAEYRRSDPDV